MINETLKFLTQEKLADIRAYNNKEWLNIIICTATSKRHIQSICKKVKVEKMIKRNDIFGSIESEWMILSFSSFDIHLFTQEKRDYYDLDELWSNYEIHIDELF